MLWGKKETHELYATYGRANAFGTGGFSPLTRNLCSHATLQKSHHCPRCKKAPVTSCYEFPDPHFGFCSVWVTHQGKRERCGERFTVWSAGCGKHPKTQGYNSAFYRAARGEDVDMAEFSDPETRVSKKPEGNNNANFTTMIAKAAEKFLSDHGYIPHNFNGLCYAEYAKVEARSRQAVGEDRPVGKAEDRTQDFAVIRSGATFGNKLRRSLVPQGTKKQALEVPRTPAANIQKTKEQIMKEVIDRVSRNLAKN